ncbi:MAG: tyrosine-type recombinase/integrase [Candidatus Bathyarchaeia archaeon]
MNLEEFMKSGSVQTWLTGLKSSPDLHSTKYHWAGNLKRFCEWAGKTPDQLIEERKEQLRSEDQRERYSAELKVKAFLDYLTEQGKSPNTRKNHFSAIRNFYKRNYYELTFFRGDGPENETVQEGSRAASKDDINKMLEVSNPRIRALLLFLKDTGLAEADCAKLKLKDINVLEQYDVRPLKEVSEIFLLEPPIPIIVKRKKTKRLTITFMGKESLDALKTTLRLRQQGSAELTIRRYDHDEHKLGIGPETLTLESPLFRSYEKFFQRTNMKVNHLSPAAIGVIVRKAAINAGCWKEGFAAHSLRRYFQTNLEMAGTNPNWIKKMMGHALEGSEGPYSRPEVVTLGQAYMKAYSLLAVSEVAAQKSRVESLEAQVAALSVNGHSKSSEIDDLRCRMAEMEKTLENISKFAQKASEKLPEA